MERPSRKPFIAKFMSIPTLSLYVLSNPFNDTECTPAANETQHFKEGVLE
jgi:hypothetical protein